eukprot:CAMPEP_0197413866 /NCGR_PEP_ID=MMETSP1170-20131217/666_1 /TAXON_ID=54406 /ORGANISM="Sarcinochrysis sp, Strain CCMP770" /LENGTH=269 /DNA_ID=CAMNT_0042940517 /DNA_START=46 /DNA_END=857 /DNA_ORIENTATION=+
MAESASKLANQAKLSTEISSLREKIVLLKRRWGEECFDPYGVGDLTTVAAKHADAQRRIAAATAELQAKEAELAATKVPKAPPVQVARAIDRVAVTVPPGVQPGQSIRVAKPDGTTFDAVVPAGCAPGSTFYVDASLSSSSSSSSSPRMAKAPPASSSSARRAVGPATSSSSSSRPSSSSSSSSGPSSSSSAAPGAASSSGPSWASGPSGPRSSGRLRLRLAPRWSGRRWALRSVTAATSRNSRQVRGGSASSSSSSSSSWSTRKKALG